MMCFLSIRMQRNEQKLKAKYGNINLAESDITLTNKNVIMLLILGFMGGLLAGALGLGGGVIFNPVLLAMGLPP